MDGPSVSWDLIWLLGLVLYSFIFLAPLIKRDFLAPKNSMQIKQTRNK